MTATEVSSIPAKANDDAIRARETSPWSFGVKVRRVLWMFARGPLFRCSFHNWYAWRRLVLKMFGAKLGPRVRVRATTRIEMPWNLDLSEGVIVGDYAILYSLGKITIGRFSVISQYSHLCAGTHDHTKRSFPVVVMPITIGSECWVAAESFIGPGVTVGDRSIIGARSSVFSDVPPDVIASGNPAGVLKERVIED
jgi:putative colanic acid biosynthesis acetyltransferase WcaF